MATTMADNREQKVQEEQINTNNCVENGSINGTKHSNEAESIEDQPEREITQTDHLNKRLLDSFLQRINQNSAVVPRVERISTSDNEEEFETDNTEVAVNRIQ